MVKKLSKKRITYKETIKERYRNRDEVMNSLIKHQFREALEIVDKVTKSLSGVYEDKESALKDIMRVKFLINALWKFTDELRDIKAVEDFCFYFDMCPELEKPMRVYLKQCERKRKKVS